MNHPQTRARGLSHPSAGLALAVIVLVSGAFLATPVRAQTTPEAALAEVREMTLYARYREALEAARTYLERDDLDAAQRNAGLELLATVHVAMGQRAEMEEVLAQLYARDPEHRLSDPDASPPVLSAFGRARSNPPAPITVSVEHEPPALTDRVAPRLDVTLGEGADAVEELRLRYRRADESSFSTVVMNRSGDTAGARVPLTNEDTAYEVFYYVEGLAPSGARLVTVGTADEPLAFTVPERQAPVVPVGNDGSATAGESDGGGLWWIGVVAGVVAVGVGVTLAILLTRDTGPENGSLGNIELPLGVSF